MPIKTSVERFVKHWLQTSYCRSKCQQCTRVHAI